MLDGNKHAVLEFACTIDRGERKKHMCSQSFRLTSTWVFARISDQTVHKNIASADGASEGQFGVIWDWKLRKPLKILLNLNLRGSSPSYDKIQVDGGLALPRGHKLKTFLHPIVGISRASPTLKPPGPSRGGASNIGLFILRSAGPYAHLWALKAHRTVHRARYTKSSYYLKSCAQCQTLNDPRDHIKLERSVH